MEENTLLGNVTEMPYWVKLRGTATSPKRTLHETYTMNQTLLINFGTVGMSNDLFLCLEHHKPQGFACKSFRNGTLNQVFLRKVR